MNSSDYDSMRDLCNRIAHDYLPEHLLRIYQTISGDYGAELLRLRDRTAGSADAT